MEWNKDNPPAGYVNTVDSWLIFDQTHWGPVWLDQNWNRFQNPLRLFRPDFPKPNPDSWNHETSPGAGFFGFKMADGDGQVSVETSICFSNLQSTISQ